MWFFSQGLYYMKRESEFNILQALGAKVKEIRQIYVQGGLIMAGLSLVVSTVLSFLGSYALFYVYNVIMPYFTHENVRYAFFRIYPLQKLLQESLHPPERRCR